MFDFQNAKESEMKIRFSVIAVFAAVFFAGILSGAEESADVKGPIEGQEKKVLGFYEPCETTEPYPAIKGEVKNVIFLIGDGMGLSQVVLARTRVAGVDGKLHMERMPVVGIVRTHAANAFVTDSAASGTALATGFKTNNGMISVLPDGRRVKTILESMQDKGARTGLVATSTITHATPAVFASHVRSRGNEVEIAAQLLENKIDVLIGGGRFFFLPQSEKGGKREDGRNLIDEAKSSGFVYAQNKEELRAAKGKKLLCLLKMGSLSTNRDEPMLDELTSEAIGRLKGDRGFFLMVEGSKIDWACHGNDARYCLKEMLLFDEAVKVAMEFALEDKETLVIVTADHETGGLVINGRNSETGELELNWSNKGHTATPVPLYALGPGAEEFSGVYDNTEVPKRIAKLLGIKDFPKIIE